MSSISSSSSQWGEYSASYQSTSEGKQTKTASSIQIPDRFPDVLLARIFEFVPGVIPVLSKVRLLTKKSDLNSEPDPKKRRERIIQNLAIARLDRVINDYLKGTGSKRTNEVPKFESVKQLRKFLEVYGKNVSHLDLSLYALRAEGLIALVKNCPNLTSLNLGHWIGEREVIALAKNCPNLTSLARRTQAAGKKIGCYIKSIFPDPLCPTSLKFMGTC